MTMRPQSIILCGVCLFVTALAGCAATGATGTSARTPTTSLARALPSVQPPEQAASRPPNREEALRLFRLAIQQMSQRNDQQALRLFEQSAQADPTQPATQNNLGILYKRTGQLDKAIEAYQQAIAQQSSYPEAHYNLALAYRAKGAFAQAEDAYLKALSYNEQFIDARYNLGILYDLYLGQPAKALEQYRAYLRLNGPRTEEVTRWAATLERVVPPTPSPETPAAPASTATGQPAAPPSLEH
jgi:tetratricopeptide (TPR) repeat protein